MTQRFVEAVKSFAARSGIEIVSFRCGERKDDRTLQYRRHWAGGEGVLYIAKAQEKAKVVHTERRRDPATGDTCRGGPIRRRWATTPTSARWTKTSAPS